MADLERRYGTALTCTLEGGDRGVFNVVVDGELVFSKNQRGRFPNTREIAAAIDSQRSS